MPSAPQTDARLPRQGEQRRRWAPWAAVVARLLVGGVFVFAGFSKLLLPVAEVEAFIRQYEVIPAFLVPTIAVAFPWLELVSGTALCMGFYTTPAAMLIAAQLVSFSLLMLVVLATGVTIEDCGCFGSLGLSETPLQVLIRDLVMLGMLVPIWRRRQDRWALDSWGIPPASP